MQKNVVCVTVLCVVGMSTLVYASDPKPSDNIVTDVREIGHEVRNLTNDVVDWADEAGQKVQRTVVHLFEGISHHKKEAPQSSKLATLYSYATASAFLTYGMQYAHIARQGWRAAAALGGNVATSLHATPLIGGGLQSAAQFLGSVATNATSVCAPYAGCIAGLLFAGKVVYDCRDLRSDDAFKKYKADYQKELDKEKAAYIKTNPVPSDMNADQLREAKARVDEAYTAKDWNTKLHVIKAAAYKNLCIVGDASLKIGAAAVVVMFLGTLAQQR